MQLQLKAATLTGIKGKQGISEPGLGTEVSELMSF
jgi:hypothetical protein